MLYTFYSYFFFFFLQKAGNKPESVDLCGAHIEWAKEKSSRKNVFQVRLLLILSLLLYLLNLRSRVIKIRPPCDVFMRTFIGVELCKGYREKLTSLVEFWVVLLFYSHDWLLYKQPIYVVC